MSDNQKLAVACIGSAAAAAAVTYLLCAGDKKNAAATNKKEEDPSISRDRYETDALTRQYLEFHFTPSKVTFTYDTNIEQAFDFPIRLAHRLRQWKPQQNGRVLDLGCAVGATSFELARDFKEVIGIDLSSAFISTANEVKKNGRIAFEAPEQGQLSLKREFVVPTEIDRARIQFVVGDALNIDPALGNFDAIIAANLLCRVPSGEKLFQQLEGRLNKGGILLLVSPYSWSEEATASKNWFGGCNGQRSEPMVKQRLLSTGKLELVHEGVEPFLIRDHGRRFQLGFSHLTVWRRL